METGDIIEKLTAKRWIALVLIGVGLVVVAGAKEIWGLKIEDPLWKYAIGALGLIPIGLGVWDAFRTTDSSDEGLKKDYGFKIISPGDNANVDNEFELEGTYEKKPPEDIPIRSFVFSPNSGSYWTSSRPIQFNESAKRWSVTVRPGGTVGDKKFVGLALLGKNSALLCRYYDHVSQRIVDLRRQFDPNIGSPGIPGMPSDWKECARIAVRRA